MVEFMGAHASADDQVGAPMTNLNITQSAQVMRDHKRWQIEPSVPMILSAQAY